MKKIVLFLKIGILIFLLFALNSISICSPNEIPLISMEDFFRNPEQINFSLYPNGVYRAFLQLWENRLNIRRKSGKKRLPELLKLQKDILPDIYGLMIIELYMPKMKQEMKIINFIPSILMGQTEKL